MGRGIEVSHSYGRRRDGPMNCRRWVPGEVRTGCRSQGGLAKTSLSPGVRRGPSRPPGRAWTHPEGGGPPQGPHRHPHRPASHARHGRWPDSHRFACRIDLADGSPGVVAANPGGQGGCARLEHRHPGGITVTVLRTMPAMVLALGGWAGYQAVPGWPGRAGVNRPRSGRRLAPHPPPRQDRRHRRP
jgi:hypothetical protein